MAAVHAAEAGRVQELAVDHAPTPVVAIGVAARPLSSGSTENYLLATAGNEQQAITPAATSVD